MSWCHFTSSPPRGALKFNFEWWNFTFGPMRSHTTSAITDCDANSQYVAYMSVGALKRLSRGSSAVWSGSRSYSGVESVSARLASTTSSVTARSRASHSSSTRAGTLNHPSRRYWSTCSVFSTAGAVTVVTSAPVVHAGVFHPQHVGLLVLEKAAVEHLAHEERVVPGFEPLAHLAVEIRHRLREHRRAGELLEVREPVQRLRVEIDLDRLRELAHDRAVLAIDEGEREHAARVDQLVREGAVLDADANPLRVERDLRHPVHRHAVA